MITIHDIEMLRGSWLPPLLGPTWPGLRPRSQGARSARLRVPSFVSSLARQSRVSLCREPGCTGHVNCEQSQASENHECSLQVNNNRFGPSSLWSTISSSVPENYTNMGDPAAVTLFYYDIKIKWKRLSWRESKNAADVVTLVTCQSWRFACNSISLSSRCQNPRIIIQNLAFFS